MLQVLQFIQDAIECSVYLAPRDIGLTYQELQEAAKQAGHLPGETNDALASPMLRGSGSGRYVPVGMGQQHTPSVDFLDGSTPEYRNWKAFEFVRQELLQLGREVGKGSAKLARDVFVERGVAAGHERMDIDVAITVTVLNEIFQEKDGAVSYAPYRESYGLPSQQVNASTHFSRPRPTLERTYGIVRDVIERRTDRRAPASNPLDAFEARLAELGHDRFRAWWVQKRHEIRIADPSQQPTAVLVLAASLVEACLSFVVPRAKAHGLMSRIEASKPKAWRFDELVKGAKSGDASLDPILDERTATRALDLNATRQRIHAGYLIDTQPTGPIPDLKPEEARDALQTTDLVVRRVVDWLARHPGP